MAAAFSAPAAGCAAGSAAAAGAAFLPPPRAFIMPLHQEGAAEGRTRLNELPRVSAGAAKGAAEGDVQHAHARPRGRWTRCTHRAHLYRLASFLPAAACCALNFLSSALKSEESASCGDRGQREVGEMRDEGWRWGQARQHRASQ